ncbi:hypothetical protein [Mesorhizobium sp. WSM3859]|uniref:hypothetical protein n=1 Tax=Mesorhizobium sp. WSM3859 TaxID=2029402 RepID=UPI000BAFA259|nr:hypothetical protein [Mesorhizobium sp. WSM3859]PBC11797.1 hypothetical protein CK230_00030 [Mesorhizobium sp. WSM3859]
MDDLQLTKKGEAYVAAQIAQPERSAETDLLTLQIDRSSRKALSLSIAALIDMLDDLSPDPDIEDGADLEPSLGWSADGVMGSCDDLEGPRDDLEPDSDTEPNGDERDASATPSWAKGGHWCEDVEEENEHGGDILDEPHDGRDDDEPWLGWSNPDSGAGTAAMVDVEDSPDYGCGGFTGEGVDMARQMLRNGRCRRPEPSLTIVGPVVTVPGYTGPLSQADVGRADGRTRYWEAKGF